MSWPQGQKNGSKWVEQLNGAPLQAGAIIAPAGGASFVVPWYSRGYSNFWWSFVFSLAVGGNVEADIFPMDSDGNNLFGLANLIPSTVTFPPSGAGNGGWSIAFDDGPFPGNYQPLQVIPGIANSLPLNPTWNKAPFFTIAVTNSTTGNLTVGINSILLASR